MTRVIIKNISQALLLFGPIITLGWSLLDLLGIHGSPVKVSLFLFEISGPKQEVELKLRLYLTALGCLFVFLNDLYDTYWPAHSLKEFRSLYLAQLEEDWRKNLLSADIRINILHARRRWFFPFTHIFYWTWSSGFAPNHLDTNLFLTSWQGVAGKAFRKRQPLLVDMRGLVGRKLPFHERWLLFNQFHLWHWQLSKTEPIKCILSIPIFIASKDLSPRWQVVGVINLDSLKNSGAEFLIEHKELLANFFTDHGKVIALLR